ncbi:MAG: MurR/RpiR family transcriptional regulator [Acidimicrobiia bacterium]
MNIQVPAPSLADLIAAVNDQLTPSEELLARAVLDDPTIVAFGTVADLARHVDVSRPTVVRFARTLGFGGYSDLQARARDALTDTLNRPSARIRGERSPTATVRAKLFTALDHLFAHLPDERLASMVDPIVTARRVLVVSGETSRAGAAALMSGLTILGKDVVLIDDHRAGGQLGAATTDDCVVAFDFRRYRKRSLDAVAHLDALGATIVAVTDGPLSPYAALADAWCDVSVPGIGPFDSSVPAVAVAEMLVAGVAAAMGEAAVASIDRTEAAWTATAAFVDQGSGA